MLKSKQTSASKTTVASRYRREKEYWLNNLAGELGSRNFTYDHHKTAAEKPRKTVDFEISGPLFNRLQKISSGSDIRLHIILTAGVMLLLSKYKDDNDVLVGIPVYKQDAEGELTNSAVVLRNHIGEGDTFKDMIIRTREIIGKAIENANYPLETLLYHLEMKASGNEFPLFDIVVLLESIHDPSYVANIPTNTTFLFRQKDHCLEGTLEYNPLLFEKATIEGIIDCFLQLMGEAMSDLDLPVTSLNMVSEEEKATLLHTFNRYKADFPTGNPVHRIFEQQVVKSPTDIAISFEGKDYSYRELNNRANNLAVSLRDIGVVEDRLVGVLLDRSFQMAVCILAVWKAGGAYVPLSADFPEQRIIKILQDSEARVLLTSGDFSPDGSQIETEFSGEIIRVEQLKDRDAPAVGPDLETNMTSLAYVIYTSGSTGEPKGVMVEHAGMLNHIYAKIKDLELTDQCIVAQNASHTFDISVWQFFTALILGGRTVIYGQKYVTDPEKFIHQLMADRVTILEVVPTYLSVMLEYLESYPSKLENLSSLLVTGETVKPNLVQNWFAVYPGIKMINAYGPTEASDDITHHIMDSAPQRDRVPIGKPLWNLDIYIVDKNMQLCPIGVQGEICVSGIGVGRGYLKDPEKTKQVFMEDPFAKKKGVRLYKTGDYGCWLRDGTVEFMGRKDSQVKIRGFRIELGEIESRLVSHKDVKEAVVVVRQDASPKDTGDINKNQSLYAYVVSHGPMDTTRLKEYMAESLPAYSVPAYFVELDSMPLTPNGKIDRNALPDAPPEGSPKMPYLSEKVLNNVAIQPMESLSAPGTWLESTPGKYRLSTGEKEEILYTFNDTAAPYPKDMLPHRLIEDQVQKTPDNVALARGGFHLTYRELNRRANRLARFLRARGVTPNCLVGIMSDRNTNLIAGILAIMKAGGAYVPIEQHYPEKRKKLLLEISGVEYLLTSNNKWLPDNLVSRVIDLEEEANYCEDPSGLVPASTGTSLIHVLYTSGTTGTPKGVMIENHSLVNLIKAVTGIVDINERDIVLSVIPTSFDMFGSETLLALTRGSKIVLGTQKQQNEYQATARALEQECTTFYQSTPSYLQYIVSDEQTAVCLRNLRNIVLAGEALPESVRDKATRVSKAKIFDLYGPTEATIFATGGEVTGDNPLHIGKPLANYKIYILGSSGELFPKMVPGELHIGGAGVARGYYGQDDLTAEKFIENPFVKGERIYKTGDLARWMPDGNIEYLGRIDHQVQIRGIRIEVGEIEDAILNHEDVKEAVVVAKKITEGYLVLFACIVSDKKLPEDILRKYLVDKLPMYMVPTYFLQLEKIPLTLNGKINRRLLSSIDLEKDLTLNYNPPRNDVEAKLVDIWENVLGRTHVGIDENFFMIGGDSIKTIQIASRMKKAGYKIEMKDIFENPTIAELSPVLEKTTHMVNQEPVSGPIPLTPIQRSFFLSIPVAAHHFNMAVMLYSEDELDEEGIRQAAGKIQEHHDALRMTFKRQGEEIVQTNHLPGYPAALDAIDLKGHDNAVDALQRKANEIQASINLEEGPLMKLGLFRLDDGDRLLIVIHHLVVDGVSWRILLEDFSTLYRQFQNREPLVLPLKTDSFKTWSEGLTRYAQSASFLKGADYWKQLELIDVPPIPKDFPAQETALQHSETRSFRLDAQETGRLITDVNKAFSTEINHILITALGIAVKQSFGHENVLLNLEGHGREEILDGVDTGRSIGWFTSAFPAIIEVSHEDDLGRQIKEVKESLRRIPNKGIDYGILKYLTPAELKKNILFKLNPEISFNYLGQFDEDIQQGIFEMAKEPAGESRNPLQPGPEGFDIVGMIAGKELEISLTYNRQQFKEETTDMFLSRFQSELSRIISFCYGLEVSESTPSDFGYKDISLEQLGTIFN